MSFTIVQLLHSGNEESRNMDMVAGENVRVFQFTDAMKTETEFAIYDFNFFQYLFRNQFQ